MLKNLFKYLIKTIFWIIAILIGYLLIAIILSIFSVHPPQPDCGQKEEIYITSNGVHLDIIVPIELLDDSIKFDLQIPDGVHYLSFGWGDKGFYLETPAWSDLKLKTALRALFLKSETVIHLSWYYRLSSNWHKLEICSGQRQLLLDYILESFERNNEGQIIELKNSGYTNQDTFYEAVGSYSCIYTCNNWVNEGLKRAKIKTSVWSPFDYGVLFHVKRENRRK